MKYHTRDELIHFDFKEAVVGDTLVSQDRFHLILDNVTILPENSCNRDIRQMRCNEMMFTIENPRIRCLIQEGYKLYDANGNLTGTFEDVGIEKEAVFETIKGFLLGNIYDIAKREDRYIFYIDTEEHTYRMEVEGSHDIEEWERFLSKDL